MQRDTKKIEELLAILEQEEDSVSMDGTDVFTFLEIYNIKPGKHKVKHQALYKLYQQWSHKPLKNTVFSLKLMLYLESKNMWWFINKEPLKHIIPLIKPKRPHPKSYKNIQLFFTEMGWKKGEFFYPAGVLYYLARDWARKNKKIVPNPGAFYLIMRMTFTRKVLSRVHTEYGIDKPLNISRQKMVFLRKTYAAKKKKK